jgi:hypothetical protein
MPQSQRMKMTKNKSEPGRASAADIKGELHDIERRLRAHPANGSSEVLALLACIFVIVASTGGLPLGILGVVAVVRQSAKRRELLKKATELERKLAAERSK